MRAFAKINRIRSRKQKFAIGLSLTLTRTHTEPNRVSANPLQTHPRKKKNIIEVNETEWNDDDRFDGERQRWRKLSACSSQVCVAKLCSRPADLCACARLINYAQTLRNELYCNEWRSTVCYVWKNLFHFFYFIFLFFTWPSKHCVKCAAVWTLVWLRQLCALVGCHTSTVLPKLCYSMHYKWESRQVFFHRFRSSQFVYFVQFLRRLFVLGVDVLAVSHTWGRLTHRHLFKYTRKRLDAQLRKSRWEVGKFCRFLLLRHRNCP